MTEKEIYIEIAERFIQCCADQITNSIDYQETIGFKAYHAFESIGGAFNSHLGRTVPGKHNAKINSFVNNYRHNAFSTINPLTIAKMAIALNSMRNKYLYPYPTPIGLKAPKDQITLAQARQLTSRINGIIRHLVSAM